MPQGTSKFLTLPRELRDEIYYHVFQQRPEVPLSVKGSKVVLHGQDGGTTYIGRPTAFLFTNSEKRKGPFLISTNALSEVNSQVRTEFSEFLRTVDVDVIARVRNFDFGHVIDHFNSLPRNRSESFCVQHDGTARCILTVELSGPYDARWSANLGRWISYVERWIGLEGELRTAHKTVEDSHTVIRWVRAPPDIVNEVYVCYQNHRRGAGRLELDRIFYTLWASYGVERWTHWFYGLNALGYRS